MSCRTAGTIGCATGLVGGVGIALLCGAGERPSPEPRYQLHVWKTEGAVYPNDSTAFVPDHGAYRLDTQTGEVYEIQSSGGMRKIGS